jgi:hypothetical protein
MSSQGQASSATNFSMSHVNTMAPRNVFLVALRKAVYTMKTSLKAKAFGIKNCARVGPEGQTKTVGATLCNAGLPPYGHVFLIT